MEHKIYTSEQIKSLEAWDDLHFNRSTGEAVHYYPAPELDPDTSPLERSKTRDREVYVGTGLFFENAYQKKTMTPEKIAPWWFPTENTVAFLQELLKPIVKELRAEIVGVAMARNNPVYPYVNADGSDLRSRELLLVTQNGITKRIPAGLLLMELAYSLHETSKEQFAFQPFTMFEDFRGQVQRAMSQQTTESGDTQVDLEA